VITEFIGSGTHDGALMDIPATGKKVSMPVCNIIEVRQGKVYAEREYTDMAHLLRQIGVLP
jgi:predicted ester cyclase